MAEKKPPTQQQFAQEQGRPRWVPKTPIDVVREQIEKQEARVEKARETYELEKSSLSKLLEAKKVLEA